jgi:hypothetical protein
MARFLSVGNLGALARFELLGVSSVRARYLNLGNLRLHGSLCFSGYLVGLWLAH